MSPRRFTRNKPHRDTANDSPDFPKSIELEQRVSRIELSLASVNETLNTLLKRITAMQAQLDHIVAKTGRL